MPRDVVTMSMLVHLETLDSRSMSRVCLCNALPARQAPLVRTQVPMGHGQKKDLNKIQTTSCFKRKTCQAPLSWVCAVFGLGRDENNGKMVGSVVLGELNGHHRRWLKFSNRNSWEGEELCSICKEIGLTQLIREPTRGEHLLDFVLSSVPVMQTEVFPTIADHKPVMATLKLSVPSHVGTT